MNSTITSARFGKSVKGKAAPSPEAKKRRRLYRVGAGLLLVLLAGWYWWPNAQVAKVRQMQQELFSTPRDQLSPEERKKKFEALRAEQEKLSPEERKDLRKEMGKDRQKKMNADAARYLAMSPAERKKVIDAQLTREQQKAPKGAAPGGPPGAGKNGAPGGPGGGGTPEQRDAMRREFLLHATAEARAGMDQMRVDMAARRAALGLPASTKGFGPPRK